MTIIDWILVVYSIAAILAGLLASTTLKESSRQHLLGKRRLEHPTNTQRETAR